MATKRKNTALKPKAKQSDNAAVYKVMAALFLLCFGWLALRALRRYYPTVAGIERLYPVLPFIFWGGFALCLVCAVVLLVLRKHAVIRAILPWCVFLFGMVGVTALSMTLELTEGFYTLYFLWGLVFVQYIIYQLYRWEFFLFSLPTISAGFLFFLLKAGFSGSMRNTLPLVISILSLICTALIACMAARNKGCLMWRKKRIRVFSKNYNPLLHYVVVALWIICIAASFILGDLFAFYCMFAAIAVEFIAAVYYTFQLN